MRQSALALAFLGMLYGHAQAQWIHTAGPDSSHVTALAISGSNIYAGTEGGGVYRSTNEGVTWDTARTGITNDSVLCLAAHGSNVYAGTMDGAFWSPNNGATWTQMMEFTIGLGTVDAMTMSDTTLFLYALGYVAHTSDHGGVWSMSNAGLPNQGSVFFLGFNGGGYLYAGTNDGVYRSDNFGGSFASRGLSGREVHSMAFFGFDVFAGTTAYGLYYSMSDNGTWTADTQIASRNIQALAMSDLNILAGTPAGVFLSTDYGSTWNSFSTGLVQTDVRAIAIGDSNVFIATWGGGVWRRPLTELLTAVHDLPAPGLPRTSGLDQNYPNPFNPATTIRYRLATSGQVSLKIYDLLGREVATLFEGARPPGYYDAGWNAGSVPSGIYFCRLRISAASGGEESLVQVRRLMLIR